MRTLCFFRMNFRLDVCVCLNFVFLSVCDVTVAVHMLIITVTHVRVR